MKIKSTFILSFLFLSLQVIGQESNNKLDFRLGVGVSLLGSGDMIAFNYENELNFKLSPYITKSISFALGRSNDGLKETASFVQGNFNLFVSPFKNTNRFDFRIGGGITYYTISDAYESGYFYDHGILVDVDYEFDKRQSFGYNIIIENSYFISDRFLVGLKLFTQPYKNGDINSGVLLKTGLKI